MIVNINNEIYEVEIIKKNNKNTYIRVKENKIVITTSYFTSQNQIKKLLEKNKNTIEKMLEKNKIKEQKKDYFYLLGIPYHIKLEQENIKIDKINKIITTPSIEKLERYLKEKSIDIYEQHLKEYYYKFEEKIPYPTLKIRKMKSRWGVCNTKKITITLNLELIHYNLDCLDYVIVHELSHLVVPNHSKKFWNIVAKYYPNYKEIRKKMGNEC